MRVLFAYDGSQSADVAIDDLQWAGLPQEAEVIVLCVQDGSLPSVTGEGEAGHSGSWEATLAGAAGLAEKAGKQMRSRFPHWSVMPEAMWGSPAKSILELSAWWSPDLIALGSHGHSRVARIFLGSVSLELVHKAPCSVRVARKRRVNAGEEPIRIVIGDDGSAEAKAIIRAVAARNWPERTEAYVISVVETLVPAISGIGASTFAQEAAGRVIREVDERERACSHKVAEDSANALRRAGLHAIPMSVEGDPRDVIIAKAELFKADAILVGARGMGRMERFLLGSVSRYLLTHAKCTVEVVRRNDGANPTS